MSKVRWESFFEAEIGQALEVEKLILLQVKLSHVCAYGTEVVVGKLKDGNLQHQGVRQSMDVREREPAAFYFLFRPLEPYYLKPALEGVEVELG